MPSNYGRLQFAEMRLRPEMAGTAAARSVIRPFTCPGFRREHECSVGTPRHQSKDLAPVTTAHFRAAGWYITLRIRVMMIEPIL
mgnify:CR=1 FL=1